ncbi:ribosome-inactivating protein saporin-7-like [Silene latifolia]|uniref:ribosome-inactivating protein saporin-7-like n=1 Tax=Silene latifolia TaxID=37657 RepID=UPI003D776D4F
MKSWLVVTVTWIVFQSLALIANAIPLDLANPTQAKYSTFLTAIRTDVKDPKLNYGGTGIPVIGPPTATYLRIDLKVAAGTVSLALKRSDLYVVGLLAKNDKNVNRAYYFNGQITSAQLDKLFPEAKGAKNQQKITEYQENYASLEKAAKMTRKKAGLGIGKLITYLGDVNGKARKVPAEATFMMVAIQMVSEAARFKYIEQMVLNNFPKGFNPDDKVLILERNWDRISAAIKGSKNGVFTPPLVLKSPEVPTSWTVSKATELNMGLLKYLGNSLSGSSSGDNDAEILLILAVE